MLLINIAMSNMIMFLTMRCLLFFSFGYSESILQILCISPRSQEIEVSFIFIHTFFSSFCLGVLQERGSLLNISSDAIILTWPVACCILLSSTEDEKGKWYDYCRLRL